MKELINCKKCKHQCINEKVAYYQCGKSGKILLSSLTTGDIVPTDECNGIDFECGLK